MAFQEDLYEGGGPDDEQEEGSDFGQYEGERAQNSNEYKNKQRVGLNVERIGQDEDDENGGRSDQEARYEQDFQPHDGNQQSNYTVQDRRGQVMSFADESASSFNQVYDESQESTGAGAYQKHQDYNQQFMGNNRSHISQPDMSRFTLQHRQIDDRAGESVTAEITNVSVEINQKMIAGGEPSKQQQYNLSENLSPPSGEELVSSSPPGMNRSPLTQTALSKFQQRPDNPSSQDSTINMMSSNLSPPLDSGMDGGPMGMMRSQKIQAYDARIIKQASEPSSQQSVPNVSGRHLDFDQHEMARRATAPQKINQLQDDQGVTNQQNNMAIKTQINLPVRVIDDRERAAGMVDAELDDMAHHDRQQNSSATQAKRTANLPQTSPHHQAVHAGNSTHPRHGASGQQAHAMQNKSVQQMSCFKQKNLSSYSRAAKNEEEEDDDEDCNSVNTQDEKRASGYGQDVHQGQDEIGGADRPPYEVGHPQQHDRRYREQANEDQRIINKVNVIDLRALSPGMRHAHRKNAPGHQRMKKKSDSAVIVRSEQQSMATSPQAQRGDSQRSPAVQNLQNPHDSQDYNVSVKKFSVPHQGQAHPDKHPEKKKPTMFRQTQNRFLKRADGKAKSPMGKAQLSQPVSQPVQYVSQVQNQDSPDHNNAQFAPPNDSQQKRHSMQSAIRQNNASMKKQQQHQSKNHLRHSNESGGNYSSQLLHHHQGPFLHAQKSRDHRNISDGGRKRHVIDKNSPVLKSVELKSAQGQPNNQKVDTNSNKQFFGSFFYGQQSLGIGSIVSNSGSNKQSFDTPPFYDASPKLDDVKVKSQTIQSNTSHSSYTTKFKNWMYNTVKTAQSNYHSKISINLKTATFFQAAKDRTQKTMLLHNIYIHRKGATADELDELNQRFTNDFKGITWFSYRDQIERPIGSKGMSTSSGLKSDSGWGCMLRTGQMMLFQALNRHVMQDISHLDIRRDPDLMQQYFNLLLLFMDNSPVHDEQNLTCPFGIHSISQEAKQNLNMEPGQWYGPQMISIALRNVVNTKKAVSRFRIHVCLDGNIFLDEIRQQMNLDNSVFVIIPLRLGIDSIQSTYLKQVKYLFQIFQNVGLMGGKDHMAIYLVGDEDIQRNNAGLFYLDPHLIQNAVPRQEVEKNYGQFSLPPQYLDTYHSTDLRTLDPQNMQTSLAPGFYLRDHEDLNQWVQQMKDMQSHFKDQCIFTIFDEKPAWMRELDGDTVQNSEPQQDNTGADGRVQMQRSMTHKQINHNQQSIIQQQQDLGPTRMKRSTSNTKKQRSFDDSFEDLKDYDFEGAKISSEYMGFSSRRFQKLKTMKDKNNPAQNSSKNLQFKFYPKQRPSWRTMQHHQQQQQQEQQDVQNQREQRQDSATSSNQYQASQSSTIGKSGGTGAQGSSTLSRDAGSPTKNEVDIDNELINIGGAPFEEQQQTVYSQGSISKKQHKSGLNEMLAKTQMSRTTNMEHDRDQLREMQNNTPDGRMGKVKRPGASGHMSGHPQQQQPASLLMKHANQNQGIQPERLHKRGSGDQRGLVHTQMSQMQAQQKTGTRTMMGLNQPKASGKIGHMQDTGMVNPKNRHSRVKANVHRFQVQGHPTGDGGGRKMPGYQHPPGSHAPLDGQPGTTAMKSRSDVPLGLGPQGGPMKLSMSGRQSPTSHQLNPALGNRNQPLSNYNTQSSAKPKSFPDIMVASVDDNMHLDQGTQGTDSVILGNTDENVAEPTSSELNNEVNDTNESDVHVSLVQQDQQFKNHESMI